MNSDTPLVQPRGVAPLRGWQPSRGAAVAASVVLVIIIAACALAPLIAPYDPTVQPNILASSQPPSLAHPFGTDPYSRDVLSRVIHGGRVSLLVAVLATLVSVTLGTAYGAAAGYARGISGAVLERLLEALLSIPRLLLLIAVFAAWREVPIKGFILILGVTGWYGLARLVRGQVLALKAQDFVASAHALGATRARVIIRHILPNVLTPVVVAATLGLGHVIVLEAGLSYLGIGVRPPDPSWGNIIQDGSDQIAAHWWISLFPGVAIVLTVMAFNVLGDALLRELRPRQIETG
ncbi:MAG: ABC transporter permease [Gemmatimonadaceae bacterium]|nr:ABC transporter permease [Gemmatimonadaceae bacterium]